MMFKDKNYVKNRYESFRLLLVSGIVFSKSRLTEFDTVSQLEPLLVSFKAHSDVAFPQQEVY